MFTGASFGKYIRYGSLTIIDANDRIHTVENGSGPKAAIRLHDPRLHGRLLLNPELAMGEAYMDGTLTVEEGTLHDFMDICIGNLGNVGSSFLQRLFSVVRNVRAAIRNHNPVGKVRRDVSLDPETLLAATPRNEESGSTRDR